jgi:hypothetical protein
VAWGAAASSASRLAVVASLLLQTGTGRQIAHSKKKLLALKGKIRLKVIGSAAARKINVPRERTIWGGKNPLRH